MMVFTMFVVLLAGCYDVSEYTGDGKLVDNGARSATDRYILNLGLIDLRKQQKYTYRISGLPEENFIAGIELTLEDPDLVGDRIIRPVIALRLSGHTDARLALRSS